MKDLRQTPQWGNYLSQIGWTVEHLEQTQVFVRKIPFLGVSVIKIQRPQNPIPFEKIDDIAKKYNALFVVIEPEIKDYNQENFKQKGYIPSSLILTYTQTIHVKVGNSTEKLFKSLSENARRNIKKAQKNNLIVKTIPLKNTNLLPLFEVFFKLLKTLTYLKRFHIPSKNEMFKKMTALKDNSILLFAYKPGRQDPIAVVWIHHHDKIMSYLHTGITQTGYDLFANYFLVWEALKLSQQMKLEIFDFEGIYDPRFPKERKSWKNFSEFKKRFHGQIINYPQPWIKIYNPFFKLVYITNSILSKFTIV